MTVGTAGSNIADCDVRSILALTWQASQHHLLSIISTGSPKLTEREAVGMANKVLHEAGHHGISGLRDQTVVSGHFFVRLVDSVRPGIAQEACVMPGETLADRLSNARYAISLARKLGFFVFVVAEDLVLPVPRMVFSFIVALLSGASQVRPL
jgi:hypothetical protein